MVHSITINPQSSKKIGVSWVRHQAKKLGHDVTFYAVTKIDERVLRDSEGEICYLGIWEGVERGENITKSSVHRVLKNRL